MGDARKRETETSVNVMENLIRANQALTICHMLMKVSQNDISDISSLKCNKEAIQSSTDKSSSTSTQNVNNSDSSQNTNLKPELSITPMKPLKDSAYWERRRRNNAAAKRSRDAKKTKETENAIRVTILQEENEKLKVQIGEVKKEIEKLKGLILSKEEEIGLK